MEGHPHPALAELVAWASQTPWICDVWLSGSLATADHCLGTSDIDVVALTRAPLRSRDVADMVSVHRRIDSTTGRGARLGCVYVAGAQVYDVDLSHPTWTHGRLLSRRLSAMVRAELLDHGTILFGREPEEVLGPMGVDDIREAVRSELLGYWTWAARRPWLFLDDHVADLALLTMSRARHTWDTGFLQTKSAAVPGIRAPRTVAAGVRRRRTEGPRAPIILRGGYHAWRDTRRTVQEIGGA